MKNKKGASIQHKQKVFLKNKKHRAVCIKNGGTIGMSMLGHVKKESEMSSREKSFFGRDRKI